MRKIFLLVPAGIILSTTAVFGVEYSVELSVLNSYNDGISGATVTVTDAASAVVHTVTTNSDGGVDVFSLEESVDDYTFSVSHDEWTVGDVANDLTEDLELTIRGTPSIGDHDFFVLESDDWLSYSSWETRNFDAWTTLAGLGHSMKKWNNDTVETTEDMEALFAVLREHDAIISPGIVTCMPDFDAIEGNGYTEYVCDDISNGLPDYLSDREGILEKHMDGYQEGVWMPTYHCKTHFNYEFWLSELRDEDQITLESFDNYVVRSSDRTQIKSEYNHQSGGVAQFSYEKQNQLVVDGIQQFVNLFGFTPRSQVAVPNYVGDETTAQALGDNGLIGLRGTMSYWNLTGDRLYVLKEDLEQDYSLSVLDTGTVRLDWQGNINLDNAYAKVDTNFGAGDPVIELTHRLNYVSTIFGTDWRDDHVEALDTFFDWLDVNYPNTIFLTSYELHQIQKYGYSIQPWYDKTIVRNYLTVDKSLTVSSLDVQTGSGWAGFVIVEDLGTGEKTRVDSTAITFTAEAGQSYQITNGLADGVSCSESVDCVSGVCAGGVCRASAAYCGNDVCDSNEDFQSCSVDCERPPDAPRKKRCSDKWDNDHDGLTDMDDPDCVSPEDDDERPDKKKQKKEDDLEKLEEILEKELGKVKKGVKVDVKEKEVSVRSVEVVSKEEVASVEVTVTPYVDVPESIATAIAVAGAENIESGYDVYQYLEIEANVEVEKATITFEVSKEWMGDREKNEIVLLHFTNGEWEELSTYYVSGTDPLVFLAETGSFSVFAVGTKAVGGFSYGWLLLTGLAVLSGAFILKRK